VIISADKIYLCYGGLIVDYVTDGLTSFRVLLDTLQNINCNDTRAETLLNQLVAGQFYRMENP
jgi:hypothetical protein